jgi:hypothetical protein
VPRAVERNFFYGVNFELSFNARYWERARNSGEIRPIIGGLGSLDFAPASRLAYNLSETWAVPLEHYADFGRFSHFEPAFAQQQILFAVVDYKSGPTAVEFGIGHGFTAASDALVLKLILAYAF